MSKRKASDPMRAPSTKRLLATFRDLSPENARLIRKLARSAGDGEALSQLIESRCEATARYVRRMHGNPYSAQIWRVTVAMHAIDVALGTHGVEALGKARHADYAAPYEYCNAGDPWVSTLIYRRESDNLYIGSWGTVADRLPQADYPRRDYY